MIKQDVLRTSVSQAFSVSLAWNIFYTVFFFAVVVVKKTFPSFSLSSFPEIRYFQDEDVRTKLTDILFCYARENEQLLYKQVRLRCLKSWGVLLSHADSYEGSHRV